MLGARLDFGPDFYSRPAGPALAFRSRKASRVRDVVPNIVPLTS